MIINESKKLNEAAMEKVNLKELDKRIKSEVDKRLYVDPKSSQREIWVNYSGTISKTGTIMYSQRMSTQVGKILKEYGFKLKGLYADSMCEVFERV